MAILIAFLGVGAVAIPTGIISAGFVEQYTRIQNQNQVNSGIRGTVSAAVDGNSPFLNLTVQAIETGFQIDVIALVRKGTVILPSDNLVIGESDILLYQIYRHTESPAEAISAVK